MRRFSQILYSSRAAIDLASIMVGIIIIGLIGGVIAATVFAVIPWSQDQAAKQQLDSIASAESAYRGLSTSKDTNLKDAFASPTSNADPNQVVLNSVFTGSAGLAKNNLLTLDANGLYCVIATTDGKDYHAYSKSGSGKWFYITSGKTQPSEYTGGNVPCVNNADAPVGDSSQIPGTVDTGIDDGRGVIPTEPISSGSGKSNVFTENFDAYQSGTSSAPGWSYNGPEGASVLLRTYASTPRSKPNDYLVKRNDGSAEPFTGVKFDLTKTANSYSFVPGKKYTVSVWVYNPIATSGYINPSFSVGGVSSAQAVNNTGTIWRELTVTFTADNTTSSQLVFQTNARGTSVTNYFYIDDITIEQLN